MSVSECEQAASLLMKWGDSKDINVDHSTNKTPSHIVHKNNVDFMSYACKEF